MAENPEASEIIYIQLSSPGETFPQDINNVVMSSSNVGNIAIPIGTVSPEPDTDIAMGNTDQITGNVTNEENPVPLQNDSQEPPTQATGEGLTISETNNNALFTGGDPGTVDLPVPVSADVDPLPQETLQEAVPTVTDEETPSVIGITHADGLLSVDIPLSEVIADPSTTQTSDVVNTEDIAEPSTTQTSVVVNTAEETHPTNTDIHEMSIAPIVTNAEVTPSKPQPKIILNTNTQVSPSPLSSLSEKNVTVPPGIRIQTYLDDQVAYKITTSDVTEAISAVRTTSSKVNTTKPLNPTTATAKPTHQLVVTSMGLVRKALIPDSPPADSVASTQKLVSPIKVTKKPESVPTISENTIQTFTLTDTHPSTGPLIPENEMIQSSQIEHLQGESITGTRVKESDKQQGNKATENMEVGSYMTVEPLKKVKDEPKSGDEMASPTRKSYRAPKRKVVKDYEEIGGAQEDESAPVKKKAKTMTVTAPAKKPVKGKRGRKAGPKEGKLTVEEVYKSGDDAEEDDGNDFLKVCMVKCDKCDKHFLDKKKLALHKRQVHKTKRSPRGSGKEHICEVCGYVFKRREHWRRHKEVHQRSRPHTCEVCNKTFKRAEHVKRHQSVHLTTKPYPCMECESAFTRPDHLTKHMLLHSDPKGYRQRQQAKKKKGKTGKGRPKGKGSKMIKTMPRGRGKVTVQLRATVKSTNEEDFEYGDFEEEFQDLETDEGDLLSTDEEDAVYNEAKDSGSLEKVY
ncbi:transcription factor Sp2-like [Saccostrea echinata]|uniref:transcription factor Sp2-like n=1 Tax=Saccostrea echinata TaxID=191078 RepID=UPI002A8027B9|nr:transcription factor Sp2-like [Saccostrea echinata]